MHYPCFRKALDLTSNILNFGVPNISVLPMQHNASQRTNDGLWIEAVALFRAAQESKHHEAQSLLGSSTDPATVVRYFLRLVGIYCRGENPTKLERFASAAHRAGPPPETPPSLMSSL